MTLDFLLNISPALSILAVFAAGIVGGITPCTLPTAVLVIGYVGGYDRNSKLRGFLLSLSFVLGLSLTLAAAGAFVSVLGSLFLGSNVLWYAAAFIAILMGANLLGLFSIPTFNMNPAGVKKGSGLLGAFLLGIPFAVIASPCTTPITATVLAFAAAKGSAWFGFISLFVFALGRSIPLLLAGTFTSVLKNTSKLGKTAVIIQKISGGILILLGLYLLYSII